MSNEAFRRDFALLMEKAGNRAQDLVRKTALQLQTSMVERSPVDSGRFKGNWQVGINLVNNNASMPPDKDGSAVIARTKGALGGWIPGMTIYLTNSLPYAKPLEYGHSSQAPAGMVRLTVQNFQAAVAEAARGLP